MARSAPKVVDARGNVRFNMLMSGDLYERAQKHVGKGRVAKLINDLLERELREVEDQKRLARLLKKRRIDDGVPQV